MVVLDKGHIDAVDVHYSGSYAFLGAPGDPVWILPQTQNANLLWAGWNSTDVPSGTFQPNTPRLSPAGVTGGELAIYQTSLGGPGTYTATFRVSGTLTSGATVSDEATYTFTAQS